MSDSFYIKDFVDMKFANEQNIDHEKIADEFMRKVQAEMDDSRFEHLLMIAGFIPDLYQSDSSEETLFSKLIECLVAEWARRMGFQAKIVKQKASYEDITITIDNRAVVCDAKSFRLGRSQAAPNAKDFLKLEDIRKWRSRYKESWGGLVTYPCRHEWTKGSDIYQYCSSNDAPTVMLPYKYLAYLLHYKSTYSVLDLKKMWDYKRIFPAKLKKNMRGGNKKPYWDKINAEIIDITNTSIADLETYMNAADAFITQCVSENVSALKNVRQEVVDKITNEIYQENDICKLKDRLLSYVVNKETKEIDKMLSRIVKFRKGLAPSRTKRKKRTKK